MVGSTIYSISSALTILINLLLGFFVLLQNKNSIINKTFALLALSVSIWALGMYFHVTTSSETASLFWGRFLHAGSIFIPPIFLHFVLALLDLDQIKSRIIRFSYICGIIFFFLNFTPYIVKSVSHKGAFIFINDVGVLYPIYILYFTVFFGFAIYHFVSFLIEPPDFHASQVLSAAQVK